ncbi:MAG: hypothetical protein RIB67_10385 [Miltoncostaeaceae bacterium]
MERIASGFIACLVALMVAAGCGGDGAGDLPSYESARAVVDAMNDGGATCADAGAHDPSLFARDGAAELVRCSPAPGGFPSVSVYHWPEGAEPGVIEEFHRVTHCSRIDRIAFVAGADWTVQLAIEVDISEAGESAGQDAALAARIAEATGGELRTIDC